jgi:hypothetical protein
MRITKEALARRWAITTILGACVFAVLAWSDFRLKALSGYGTADLQGFYTAVQYRPPSCTGPRFMRYVPASTGAWIIC